MQRTARIEKILRDQFQAKYFELENESHQHSVPVGSESHFKILIVDDRFAGLSKVESQRLIYNLLDAELKSGLHAVSMRCLTNEQWQKAQADFKSPICHSKS